MAAVLRPHAVALRDRRPRVAFEVPHRAEVVLVVSDASPSTTTRLDHDTRALRAPLAAEGAHPLAHARPLDHHQDVEDRQRGAHHAAVDAHLPIAATVATVAAVVAVGAGHRQDLVMAAEDDLITGGGL